MRDGKRLHRINISVDDDLLMHLTHLANYDRRVLADYVHRVLQEYVYGARMRLPRTEMNPNGDHSHGE